MVGNSLVTLKRAVRANLADAGLGFGIFDEDGEAGLAPTSLPLLRRPHEGQSPTPSAPRDSTEHMDVDEKPRLESHTRTSPRAASWEASPGPPSTTESLPLLPFSIFSPEVYPRDDLDILDNDFDLEALRGRFVKRYRWGALDGLNRRHSDFVPLRKAVMRWRKVNGLSSTMYISPF